MEILHALVKAKTALNNIIVVGFDEKTGWSPESVDFIEHIADALYFIVHEIDKNNEEKAMDCELRSKSLKNE